MEKEVNVTVLDKTANVAFVKEYREDSIPIYVYDLAIKTVEGEVTNYETIATDRYKPVIEAPFTLTENELKNLKGELIDG